MQQTRLNTLVNTLIQRLVSFFGNPWRRIALIAISLLLGFFMGSAVSTTAGQAAVWDVLVAGILMLFTEIVSLIFYHRRLTTNAAGERLWLNVLNAFKVGLVYSMFLEAFKIGS